MYELQLTAVKKIKRSSIYIYDLFIVYNFEEPPNLKNITTNTHTHECLVHQI